MEILVVVAIIVIILSIALPEFGKIRENQVFKNTVEDALSALDQAKSQTLASIDSSEYGVFFDSDKMVIFKGTVYSAGSADNQEVEISSPASISDVTLFGGGDELYFSRLYGVPNKTGTITISTPNYSKIITIGATGIVSVN